MTTIQKIILVYIAVVLAAFFLSVGSEEQEVPQIIIDERLTALYVRDIPLSVEIADTNSLRQLGLSGKAYLPEGVGMLFIFDTDDVHGFWMKDMLFDIDIVWINGDFSIVDIKGNITPESFPQVFKPNGASRYVLEVNAGFSEEHGIKIGDSIRFDAPP